MLGDASPIAPRLEDAHILSEDALEPFESLARGRGAAATPGARPGAAVGTMGWGAAWARMSPVPSPAPSPLGRGDGLAAVAGMGWDGMVAAGMAAGMGWWLWGWWHWWGTW